MNELFLHYIWQYQLFDPTGLKTTDGQNITIYNPGNHNENAGPDFFDSRLRFDDLIWIGKIEIHINSSDWYAHGHNGDQTYDNTILHVVWNHDKEVYLSDNLLLPTIELKKRVDSELLEQYKKLVNNPVRIPCQNMIKKVNPVTISNMITRSAIERISQKADIILAQLEANNNDWQETSYQVISKAFGIKINQEPFLDLSKKLPLKIILKYSTNEIQIKALLFGVAGFLDSENVDPYFNDLKEEFNFLKAKHNIENLLHRFHWNFGKLRPTSFPTVRLAQLSHLLYTHKIFYNWILNIKSFNDFYTSLRSEKNDYWTTHYDFGKKLKFGSNQPGKGFLAGLMINSVIPIIAATAKYSDNSDYMSKAIQLLESLPRESNKITKEFDLLTIDYQNAADSQGLIQLYNEYCLKKRCLACNIGAAILKASY